MAAEIPSQWVQLITFDDNQNVIFFGKCKLSINFSSKYLIVEPYDESIKMISVSFDQLMIKQKNILCVCSSVTNFVLFFKDSQTCKKVFNCIQKKKTQKCELLQNEILDIFYQQFLIPVLKAIKENSDFKDAVQYFINLFNSAQIKEITRNLREKDAECFSYFNELLPEFHESIVESDNANACGNVNTRNLRKRKYVDYQSSANSIEEEDKSNNDTAKTKTCSKKCLNRMPSNVSSSSFTVIRKPNYKLEQYETASYHVKNLIIYVSNDSKLCYTYFHHKGISRRRNNSQHMYPHYECAGCVKLKKRIWAKLIVDKNGEQCVHLSKTQNICQPHEKEKILLSSEFELQNGGKKLLIFASKEDRNGENYVKVCHEKHVCQPVKYDPKEKETIVKLPNFKIEKFQGRIQNLVIYDPNNKNLCYNYIFSSPRGNIFECYGCRHNKVYVIARLRHDEDGEPYVELNLQNHICEPHPEETIVRNIHVQCNKRKVVIPLESDPALCYEYVLMKNNTYRCRECCRVRFHSNIWLFGNVKDGYYAKIVDKKHVCKPIKFQEKEKRTIIKKPYYKIEKFYKNGIENKSLVVYDLENRELCFNYSWMNSKKHFRCSKCHNLNAFVTANIRKSRTDGGEFIELGLNEHVCKLLPEERILSTSEFHVPPNGKKDPSNLFVYDFEKKELWYEFLYSKGNLYRCRMCLMKSGSSQVKLFQNENGEYYVKIDEGKHFCKPTKVPKSLFKKDK